MKSRERVLTAINHQEPDRVAVDFGGHRSSGIMAIAYARLKKYLGITGGDIYVYDIPQQLAIIEPEVLDGFQVDVIELGRGFGLEKEYWKEWQLPDGTPCKIPAHINLVKENGNWFACSDDGTRIAAQPKGSLYFDQIYFPLQGVKDLKIVDFDVAFEKSMWNKLSNPPAPLGYDSEGMQKLREGAKKLRESTDRAIVALFGGNLHEIPQFLFRADNWFMMLASEPDQTHHFLDQLVEYHLNNLEKFLSAVGDYIDIIQFGDDLGMQTGPQISKKMYDTFLKPRHSILWNRAKKLANVKVMLHCCGGVYPLLPSFIEAGLDIINPVQTTCKDMEAERLKKEFGKDLVFWGGGCNTRDILGTGTPEQVAQDVRERVNILAPGGGFVFQQIHNIMANVPPENIVAMFNAVHST
ncbi:MAG: methyltransferase [Candidatus Atribacteria bacterium]|nr:methyltransferase [Candidatus Atribacteria bacterium]